MREKLRRIYSRGKYLNRRMADSDLLYRLHVFLDDLMLPVLVVLFVALYLDFFGHLTHKQHVWLLRVEYGILGYFILEILVDFALYESNKKFFRNKWFDILLVLPFFSVLKSMRAFKTLKIAKPAKPVKASKAGKAAKAGRAIRGAELATHGKRVQHTTKFFKKSWEKIARFLRE